MKGGFPPRSICRLGGEKRQKRQALITVMFSREKKPPGYWLLSLEDVRPFSAAKAPVGRFCLNLSRIMYIRQMLMPIRFVEYVMQ